jgi:hypothetical protein
VVPRACNFLHAYLFSNLSLDVA